MSVCLCVCVLYSRVVLITRSSWFKLVPVVFVFLLVYYLAIFGYLAIWQGVPNIAKWGIPEKLRNVDLRYVGPSVQKL